MRTKSIHGMRLRRLCNHFKPQRHRARGVYPRRFKGSYRDFEPAVLMVLISLRFNTLGTLCHSGSFRLYLAASALFKSHFVHIRYIRLALVAHFPYAPRQLYRWTPHGGRTGKTSHGSSSRTTVTSKPSEGLIVAREVPLAATPGQAASAAPRTARAAWHSPARPRPPRQVQRLDAAVAEVAGKALLAEASERRRYWCRASKQAAAALEFFQFRPASSPCFSGSKS